MTDLQIKRMSRAKFKERLMLVINNWNPSIMEMFDGPDYRDENTPPQTGCIMQLALETESGSPACLIPVAFRSEATAIQNEFDNPTPDGYKTLRELIEKL